MADSLTLQGGKLVLTTEEGRRTELPESHLLDMLRREMVPPLNGTALPDGVKFVEWREPFMIVVHQLPPLARQVRWIADDSPSEYGPGTTYRRVRLSLPYAITFAVYFQCGDGLFLAGNNELYFRNEPLRSKSDSLAYPALLNISKIEAGKRTRAWICTQHLQNRPGIDWSQQLCALLEHTWNGAFNRSSEHHEGSSWYTASKGVHCDLHPVERWEQASSANDAFGLTVPWKPAAHSVGQIIDQLVEESRESMAIPMFLPRRLARTQKAAANLVARFINFMAKAV
jgi:hypothetical protein